MRITLVILSLASGGAERVMSIIANYWARRHDEVTLITIDSQQSDFYALDDRINRIALDLKKKSPNSWSAVKNNIVQISALRKVIKKSNPEVVISFMDKMNVVSLLSTTGLSFPIVVSEHIDPRQLPPGGIWNLLRRLSYLRASIVVVLTKELQNVLSGFVPMKKLRVIPNPAVEISYKNNSVFPFTLPPLFMVAMGRLYPQKGFDILLDAFSRSNHKQWSLVIMGEGPERKNLEYLSKELGIESNVYLPGRIKNPHDIFRMAKFFVLSSRFEGFPMVVLEAMSCELPVISFDCPTGPNEIIRDGVDGMLVTAGDVTAMAAAMTKLMQDEGERNRLGKKALAVIDRYSIDKIMELWDRALFDVTKDQIKQYRLI